jgi:hypothetical protein
MRVPGLCFYILTIAAAALYPCRAMNSARRVTFVALMGCSSGTIYSAQEVRTYYVFGLLAICILYDMLDHGAVLGDSRAPSSSRLGWSAVLGLAVSYTILGSCSSGQRFSAFWVTAWHGGEQPGESWRSAAPSC